MHARFLRQSDDHPFFRRNRRSSYFVKSRKLASIGLVCLTASSVTTAELVGTQPEYPVRIEFANIPTRHEVASIQSHDDVDPLHESTEDLDELIAYSAFAPAIRDAGIGAAVHENDRGMTLADFDLGEVGMEHSRARQSIHIRKPVEFNGASVGTAQIHVSSDSSLSIERSWLLRILAGQRGMDKLSGVGETQFISFTTLRDRGVQLSYDPVSDKIVIFTQS